MTIYDLKPKFQNLLRPLVKKIWRMGLTPNQITIGTCLLSIAVGLWLFFTANPFNFIALPFFFFIRMALNAIDGMLAKEHQMQSPLGAVLNESTDVISDGFLYYSFSALPYINLPLLHFIIFFSAISELTGLAAVLNQKNRVYSGPSGKSDRAFLFSIMGILVSIDVVNSIIYNFIMGFIAILLILTIINRTQKAI